MLCHLLETNTLHYLYLVPGNRWTVILCIIWRNINYMAGIFMLEWSPEVIFFLLIWLMWQSIHQNAAHAFTSWHKSVLVQCLCLVCLEVVAKLYNFRWEKCIFRKLLWCLMSTPTWLDFTLLQYSKFIFMSHLSAGIVCNSCGSRHPPHVVCCVYLRWFFSDHTVFLTIIPHPSVLI